MPTLNDRLRAVGLDEPVLTLAASVIHGTRVTDREEALTDLLDYLGVLGPKPTEPDRWAEWRAAEAKRVTK